MLAGSEAFGAARLFYSSVNMARKLNVPGTDAIYQDLRKRYPGRTTPSPEVTPTDSDDAAPGSDNGASTSDNAA